LSIQHTKPDSFQIIMRMPETRVDEVPDSLLHSIHSANRVYGPIEDRETIQTTSRGNNLGQER
jgi:hypothetical protein